MAVFRLKFHECDGTVSEIEPSVDARDLADARQVAIARAREIMANEIRQGRLCLSCWIVISDRRGDNVMTLQFGEAVDMSSQDSCHLNPATSAEPSS